ncbi:DNA-binding MarR family transcriptional regulator [Pseudonocardia eucalypti]|nr:DNA-binding MarR family transcriptional regulator [Pseudonocardia eucalypti]
MARLENLLGALALSVSDTVLRPGPAAEGTALTSSERAALVTLRAHPGRGLGWLGEVLGLTSSGVTRLVARLVRAGLVSSGTAADARARVLRLTPEGVRRAELVLTHRRRAIDHVVAVLSPAERVVFEGLLDKIVAAAAADLPEALRVCRMCDRAACGAGRECPLAPVAAGRAEPGGR